MRVEQGRVELEVVELMARYTRAVDALDFDRLADVFVPEATVRYSWLPLRGSAYDSVELRGLAAIQAWLGRSLAGRPHLRRFVSNPELRCWSPTSAVATVAMHERDMRITGAYEVHAVRRAGGWRARRLTLVEEILH